MKKTALTILLLLTALILSACSAEAQMLRAQPLEQAQVQRATLAVLPDEQVYRAWMWATQTAEGRVAETAQARSTETARAWAATDAVGTSTARAIASAWAIAEARETDAVAATREAGAQTAIVQQAQVQATIAVYQIRVEQARRTAEFGAWWEYAAAPFWALLMSLLAILAWAVYSWPRVIRPDANGLPIVAMGGHVIQPPLAERRQEYTPEPSQALAISAPAVITNNLPAVAPWDVITAEWRGGDLPLGIGADGALIMTPFDTIPHLLYAGASGSGKSRYGLRALVACALASGRWRVTLLDKTGVDFGPHTQAENCHYSQVDHRSPESAAEILRRVYDEIIRRQGVLAQAGASTWERYDAGPLELVVIDEFSSLADLCDAAGRAELWKWARLIAAEGRKSGVMLALALQDPTARSIDLRIRRNCRPVAFRVREPETSRLVLGARGAEALAMGQFLTVFGADMLAGVGFAPTDNQITDLIQAANVPNLGAPEWIAEPELVATNDYNGEDRRQRVIELLSDGRSQGEVEQEVYGYRGGRAYQAVAQIARELRAGPTTTR